MKTSIFCWRDYVLRTPASSFPFKRDLKWCGFEGADREVVSDGFRISDLFKWMGLSRNEFKRKLNEGAVYENEQRLKEDKTIEHGVSRFRIKRLVLNVWFVRNWRRTFRNRLEYVFMG